MWPWQRRGLVRQHEHLAAATVAAQADQLAQEIRGDSHATEFGIDPELVQNGLGLHLVWMQELHGADESGWSFLAVRHKQVMAVIGQKRANCRLMHLMVE